MTTENFHLPIALDNQPANLCMAITLAGLDQTRSGAQLAKSTATAVKKTALRLRCHEFCYTIDLTH